MNLFYDEGWKRERETFAASGRGKDKTGFWQRKRGPKMKKKAFLFMLYAGGFVIGDSLLFFIPYRCQQSNGILCGRQFFAACFLFIGTFPFGWVIFMVCSVSRKK